MQSGKIFPESTDSKEQATDPRGDPACPQPGPSSCLPTLPLAVTWL